jgi:putative transposase
MSLPQAIHRFKSFTTSQYRTMNADQPPILQSRKLWQRNYHDHIIRNDSDLTRMRQYIHDNPLQWHLDAENPEAVRQLT